MPPENTKHLLGSHLEGGGQIIRNSLALSSLLLQPLNITNIRGNRPQGGGLKAQHLIGVQWLSEATASETVGAEKKSKRLEFRPTSHQRYWKERMRPDGTTAQVVEVDIGTPGSVTLLLQSMLPYLLFTGRTGKDDVCDELEVVIHGGTNVDHSPSVDYIEHVLFPILNEKVLPMGSPQFRVAMERRCWGGGAKELGIVRFTIPLLRWDETIPRFRLVERGDVEKFTACIVVPVEEREDFEKHVVSRLSQQGYGSNIEIETVWKDPGTTKKSYILLVCHTTNGMRLGRDMVYTTTKKSRLQGKEKAEYMLDNCIRRLQKELNHEGCVDEFLQDQLVVFQALAQGRSYVDIGRTAEGATAGLEESLHTRTAKWVAQEIYGRGVLSDGGIEGIGLKAGTLCTCMERKT